MHPMLPLLGAMLASSAAWAWNPYETDSEWSAAEPGWDFVDPARGAGAEPLQRHGYEFRHDPKLDARQADRRHGWQFRPRSEREQARSDGQDRRYPPIDERAYDPQEPWHSYRDEGTAFGYHAEDPGSDRWRRQWPR